MKSVGTIISPRAKSNRGVVRRDNHGLPHRINPHFVEKLPDIIKRGPINKKKPRTIVGLSLQQPPPGKFNSRSRSNQRMPLKGQRNSIE